MLLHLNHPVPVPAQAIEPDPKLPHSGGSAMTVLEVNTAMIALSRVGSLGRAAYPLDR